MIAPRIPSKRIVTSNSVFQKPFSRSSRRNSLRRCSGRPSLSNNFASNTRSSFVWAGKIPHNYFNSQNVSKICPLIMFYQMPNTKFQPVSHSTAKTDTDRSKERQTPIFHYHYHYTSTAPITQHLSTTTITPPHQIAEEIGFRPSQGQPEASVLRGEQRHRTTEGEAESTPKYPFHNWRDGMFSL